MAWGQQSSKGYGDKKKESSRIYARPGIDTNPRYQTLGKLGECAFCLYTKRSPNALDWGPDLDRGWDVIHRAKSFDIKTSTTSKLIWPVTKNHFLEPPKANIFVAVNGRDWFYDDVPRFTLLGWIPARIFIREHKTAPPPEHFDPGTKYMDAESLFDISRLVEGFGGYCDCGAPGLYVRYEGLVATGKQLWFCQEHA